MPVSTVLITGATSGIGEALSHLLLEKGMHVIAVGRSEEQLSALAGQGCETLCCDLADPDQRKALVLLIYERAPDLVINSAGVGLYGPLLSHTNKEQMALIEVNANATIEVSMAAARALLSHKKHGVVMNISSTAGTIIFPEFTTYAASKAFVNSFSQAFDYEMKEHGIRILVSCPGQVKTPFRSRAGGGKGHSNQSIPVDKAARAIWRQIKKRRPLQIFDWRYRLGVILWHLLPRPWALKMVRDNIRARKPAGPLLTSDDDLSRFPSQ